MNEPTYPAPHHDEDNTCECPDHTAMREARQPRRYRFLRSLLESYATAGEMP